MEDVDLSVRAWRLGWKCYFEPMSVCRHKTSTSIATKEKKNFIRKIYNRNKMYFHAIHLQGFSLAGWYIQTFLELLFRIITFRLDYLKSFIAFVKTFKKVRHSRFNWNVRFRPRLHVGQVLIGGGLRVEATARYDTLGHLRSSTKAAEQVGESFAFRRDRVDACRTDRVARL